MPREWTRLLPVLRVQCVCYEDRATRPQAEVKALMVGLVQGEERTKGIRGATEETCVCTAAGPAQSLGSGTPRLARITPTERMQEGPVAKQGEFQTA